MKLIYPAVFKPFTDQSGGYVVEFPDLPGCVTEGKDLAQAIEKESKDASPEAESASGEGLGRADYLQKTQISNSGGTSSSSGAYFPFFLRCLTHSVRRYSICPLTDRKSSSAQAAMASYSLGDNLRGTCFLFSAIVNINSLNLLRAVRHGFRTVPPEGWRPLRPCVPRPDGLHLFRSVSPEPFPPCPRPRPRSFSGHR